MDKIRFIILAVLIGLSFNQDLVIAGKVPGYIVLNCSDTIFGEIKVSRFDIYTGGIVFWGINLEPFHSIVKFRDNKNTRFITYTTDDISGFGFLNKMINYRFKRFLIEYNSIVKSDRERLRFLNLIYQGELSVYRDIVREDNYIKTGTLNDKVVDYYHIYMYDEKYGLKKIVKTKDYISLKDLLIYYEIDQEFIEQLPSNIQFKDIVEILQEYERWKEKILEINKNLAQQTI